MAGSAESVFAGKIASVPDKPEGELKSDAKAAEAAAKKSAKDGKKSEKPAGLFGRAASSVKSAVGRKSDAGSSSAEADDSMTKTVLLNRLDKYWAAFGEQLQNTTRAQLSINSPLQSITAETIRVEAILDSDGATENLRVLLIQAAVLIESIPSVQAPGFAYVFERSLTTKERLVQQLGIKYSPWLALGPELKMLVHTMAILREVRIAAMSPGWAEALARMQAGRKPAAQSTGQPNPAAGAAMDQLETGLK